MKNHHLTRVISLYEFTHPFNEHLLNMRLLYSQLYIMENKDGDGNISFYFHKVVIFKRISKCITSSNPK